MHYLFALSWRVFNRKSWWRLFDQAIYIYLISCRIKSNCRVKLLNSIWVLKFNFSTRLNTFSKKFQLNSTLFKSSTWLDAISLTEEHFKEFWNHFSQISDADSLKSRMKSSSAASFIHEDDESFAETIILLMFYEIWKT